LTTYVVISGVPASGKSTVGAALASRAELPLFDKDDFLERLFAASLPTTPLDRRQLSQRADRAFQSAVESSQGGIVVSWWKHPKSDRDSGTPTDWLLNLPGHLVELYCKCSPQVAVARFLSRRRHSGHLDELWSNQELSALLEQASSLGPLHIGAVVEVDCTESVDFGYVWTQLMERCQGT
jgi:gluconate kinase